MTSRARPTRTISSVIPAPTYTKLRAIAGERNVSVSALCSAVVTKFVDQLAEQGKIDMAYVERRVSKRGRPTRDSYVDEISARIRQLEYETSRAETHVRKLVTARNAERSFVLKYHGASDAQLRKLETELRAAIVERDRLKETNAAEIRRLLDEKNAATLSQTGNNTTTAASGVGVGAELTDLGFADNE